MPKIPDPPKYPLGIRKVYDPEHTEVTYGYFKCETCGSRYYGGAGPAIHKPDCATKGYDENTVVYCYGPTYR